MTQESDFGEIEILEQGRVRHQRVHLLGELTPREREVMTLVVAGRMNKQVADDLHLAEITVKIHRGAAMKKMGARSLAELVRMTEALQLPRAAMGR